jgi:purine-binding chemotaxis protein CheW
LNTDLNENERAGIGKQYLFIFSFHNSLFAIDAMAVRETFRLPEITPIEETPPYIVGVVNLRGRIVPVIDLNIRFRRVQERYHLTDGIIIVEVEGQPAGIIVNEVHDLLTIRAEDIDLQTFPGRKDDSRPRFVRGEVRVGEDIIMILDHKRLLGYREHGEGSDGGSEMRESESLRLPPVPPPAFSEASPGEKEIFHSRAIDLMKKVDEESLSALQPFVVVGLGGEYFGIDLKSVQEFSHITNLTPVPNCPEHVIGNMNLRGSILTVMDIRDCMGMPAGRFSRSAKVVVTSVNDISVGVAVDDIYDIAYLSPSDISPLPTSVRPVAEKYAKGTARYSGRAMMVLNIPEIVKNGSLIVNGKT